jgi:8-oxo-dGTP diphosphatase
MTHEKAQVVKAFIYRGDRLLLQLRDDRPDILFPNCWGLFGGTVDSGETQEQAIERELQEELNWTPHELQYLLTWEQSDPPGLMSIFATQLDVEIDRLQLTEGQALGLFTLPELVQLPLVPEIRPNLSQVIEAIASAELTAAWQSLAKQST